jgi:hypothetical protein
MSATAKFNELVEKEEGGWKTPEDLPVMPLAGVQPPPVEKTFRETPRARILMFSLAGGLPLKVAAERAGLAYNHASSVARQPWFQERLLLLMQRMHLPGVRRALEQLTEEALVRVRELMHFSEDEKVAASCAFKVLSLSLGDKVSVTDGDSGSLEDIERRIEDARRKMDEIEHAKVAGKPVEGVGPQTGLDGKKA